MGAQWISQHVVFGPYFDRASNINRAKASVGEHFWDKKRAHIRSAACALSNGVRIRLCKVAAMQWTID